MSNKFNTTQLYIDRAEERGIVHRDYLAHCLRWTHILRHAKMGQAILDVGCGINTPLAWTMYTNKFKPRLYVGVDYRPKFETDPLAFNFICTLLGNFNATDEAQWLKYPELSEFFDVIVCLEVLEHMEKSDGLKLLENLSTYLGSGVLYLSTPCFNGSKAANHLYEWRYDELKCALEELFTLDAHFGTFASQADLLPHASETDKATFQRLQAYYDTNVLAILLAPLYPEYSRNCIWRLRSK